MHEWSAVPESRGRYLAEIETSKADRNRDEPSRAPYKLETINEKADNNLRCISLLKNSSTGGYETVVGDA